MNCHEAKERLTEGRPAGAVGRHLEACADCAAYARELRIGGREIADAFLASAPSPGFEARVAARLAEPEIAAAARPRRPFAVLAAVAVLLLGGAGIFAFGRGGGDAAAPPAPAPAPAAPLVVLTEPEHEYPLLLYVERSGTEAETTLGFSFAGAERTVPISAGVEDELLRAWAMGARRAEITVAADVPGREITFVLDGLEKTGYEYQLFRRKP